MAAAVQMPPIVASWYYTYLKLTPTYRRNLKVVDEHIEAYGISFIPSVVTDRLDCRGTKAAHAMVTEAQAIGEEPAPAKSMIGMVVQRETTPGAEKLSPKELRDEALAFLLYVYQLS